MFVRRVSLKMGILIAFEKTVSIMLTVNGKVYSHLLCNSQVLVNVCPFQRSLARDKQKSANRLQVDRDACK